MACKTIEVAAETLDFEKLIKTVARGKDLKFDFWKITLDEDASKHFAGLFSSDHDTVNTAIEEITDILVKGDSGKNTASEHKSYLRNKLAQVLNNKAERNNIRATFKGKDAQETKNNVIALTAVLDAVNSEQQLAHKYGVSKAEVAEKNADDQSVEWTSLDKVAQLVGKTIMDSEMKFLKGGIARNAHVYKQIGMDEINRLEKEGLLQINENGSYIVGGMRNIKGQIAGKTKLTVGPTVAINPKKIDPADVESIYAMGMQAKRLVLPYSELAPTAEPRDEVMLTHTPLGEGVKEVILALNQGKHAVNEDMAAMFEVIHDLYIGKKHNGNTISFVRMLKDSFSKKNEFMFLKDIMGINFNDSSLFHESNIGVEQSKLSPLIALMENWDDVNKREMYFSYFQAKNARFFQSETILNDQSSKTARYIKVASENVEYSTDEEIRDFKNRLVADSGLHSDVVDGSAFEEGYDGPIEVSKELRTIVESMIEMRTNGVKRGETMIKVMNMIAKGKLNEDFGKPLIAQSSYEKQMFISAIVDVHMAKDGVIKSKHMSESDATASGPMLKLLQNIHIPAVREMVERLGVEGFEIELDKMLSDVYGLVEERLDAWENEEINILMNEDRAKEVSKIKSFMKIMGFPSKRDLVKMPIMKYFYGQTDENNAKAIGEEHAQDIMLMGSKAINAAVKLFELELKPVNQSILTDKDIEAEYYDAISNAIENEIGKFLVSMTSEVFGDGVLNQNKEDLASIHNSIKTLPFVESKKGFDKDAGIHVKIMNPVHKINWEENNPGKKFVYSEHLKHRLSLDKLNETLVQDPDMGDIVAMLNHENENSIQVIPIHMLDAAIIIRSTKKLYDQLKKKYEAENPGKKFKDGELEKIIHSTPVRLVHDAITVPSKYAGMVGKIYEQEIMHVTRSYNVTQMALEEYFYKHKIAEDSGADINEKHHAAMLELKKKADADAEIINNWIDGNKTTENIDGKDVERYGVMRHSFDTDISDQTIKAKNEKAEKRMKGRGDKVKEETPPPGSEKVEETVDEEESDGDKRATETIEAIDRGNYVVFDTETTGTEKDSIVHEIAYKIGDKTVVINLPIDEDMKLSKDFIAFYKTYNKLDENATREDIVKHINDKANSKKEIDSLLEQMRVNINGKDVIGHHVQFDIDRMKNREETKDIVTTAFDTLPVAQRLGITKDNKQETLVEHYEIKKDKAHTAEGDVNSLAEVIVKMRSSNKYHDLGSGRNTENKLLPGSDVADAMDAVDVDKLDAEHKEMYEKIQKFISENSEVEFVISNDSRYTKDENGEKIEVAVDDMETFIEDFSHEIDHANTYGYIQENSDTGPVRYMNKAIDKIVDMGENAPIELAEGANRLRYIGSVLESKGKDAAVAELVAIMNSEPEAAKQIKQILDSKPVMKNMLQKLIDAVKKFIGDGMSWDKMKEVNADNIVKAVDEVVEKGAKSRKDGKNGGEVELGSGKKKQSEADTPKIKHKIPDKDTDAGDILSDRIGEANVWLAEKIEQGMFDSTPWVKDVFEQGSEIVRENIPFYGKLADIMDDGWNSEAIQGIRNYTMPDHKLYMRMHELGTSFHTSRQNMMETIGTQSAKINKELHKAYKTPKEIRKVDDVLAKAALFNVVNNGMLDRLVKNESLTSLIEEMSKELTVEQRQVASDLSKLYMHGDISGKTIRNNAKSYGYSDKIAAKVETMATLRSLESINGSVTLLRDMKRKHGKLFTQLTMLTKEVKAMDDKVHSIVHPNGKKDINVGRGNLIDDVSEDDYIMKDVTERQANSKKFLESGWEIIRNPGPKSLGIAVLKRTQEMQEGVGLNTSYIKTGVPIRNKMYGDQREDGIVETIYSDTHKVKSLVLTEEEMDKLGGYLHDPVKSLLRAYAHKELIAETQQIREVVSESMTKTYKNQGEFEKDAVELMKEGEHPIFVRLPSDVMYKDLSKDITRKYTIAESDILTDVGGFREGNILVRKDVSSQMVGYKEMDPFQGNNTASRILKGIKNVIRYAKINQIVLNPKKIFLDLVGGMSMAAAKGSSIPQMVKYGKEVPKYTKEISDLRNKLLELKFEKNVHGTSSKLDAEIKATEEELETHPFSAAYAHGFMQSMSTELLVKDADSIRGLEADMLNLVKKLTKDNKGELTEFNKWVHKIANLGGTKFGVETLYSALGDRIEKMSDGNSVSNVLKNMSEEMKKIKSDEDMTRYIGELVATPGSLMVKLGSALTLYADLIPRWVIYKTNLDDGMSDEDAAKDALISLPNYLVQMPRELKFLSDLYILPFPSFSWRMFMPITQMFVNKPASVATQLGLDAIIGHYLGMGGGSIVATNNPLAKLTGGYMVTNPNDILKDGGNLIPYKNMFDFL